MNRLDIRTRARERLDDTVSDYLWSDDELNFEIDRAIEEACLRNNNLITDSDTSSVCDLSIVAGTNSYAISDRILKIWRIKLPSVVRPLSQVGYKALDDANVENNDTGWWNYYALNNDWENRDGAPVAFALDMNQRKLILSHNPITTETGKMTVSRLPIAGLVDDNAEPEIDSLYHYDLRDWVCYSALMKRDVDAQATQLALQYLAAFEKVFGKRKDQEFKLKQYPRRAKARFF